MAARQSHLWVVCGAGRGVGKTTVVQKLAAVLPGCVTAKCGHGKVKPDRESNFFHSLDALACFVDKARPSAQHIVVESNAWARQGRGEVTIFIGGIEGDTRLRPDAGELEAAADVCITAGAPSEEWPALLKRVLPEKKLRDAVCDIFADQREYLLGPHPTVRTKAKLEKQS